MKHHFKKLMEKPILAGIVSSILVITYCGLIALFFKFIDIVIPNGESGPEFFIIGFMLILFVLSAAVCGILIFGMPSYYIIQKQIPKAIYFLIASLLSFVFFLILIANILLLNQVLK